MKKAVLHGAGTASSLGGMSHSLHMFAFMSPVLSELCLCRSHRRSASRYPCGCRGAWIRSGVPSATGAMHARACRHRNRAKNVCGRMTGPCRHLCKSTRSFSFPFLAGSGIAVSLKINMRLRHSSFKRIDFMNTIRDFELSLLLVESGQGADIGRDMRRIMLHFLPDPFACRHPKHACAKRKESLEDVEVCYLRHDRPPLSSASSSQLKYRCRGRFKQMK